MPTLCMTANSPQMVEWLLGIGVLANTREPEGITSSGDGCEYGVANALVYASSLESVAILCACGADTKCMFIHAQYEEHEP